MKIDRATDCLGLIDIQPTFMPGGGLAVAGGDEIVPLVNKLTSRFSTIFATQDWHPAGHSSFASSHPGKRPYDVIDMPYGPQTLWPDHGIQGSAEAELHPALNLRPISLILRKGLNPAIDSYSAFRENDRRTVTGLAGWLAARGIRRVVFAGIATDFCVAWSAMDAIEAGFEAVVVEDACRGVSVPLPDGSTSLEVAMQTMRAAGVTFVKAWQVAP